jgi:hypothetical protein
MNSLLLFNNNIIRFLRNDYVYIIFVILLLILGGCTFQNKLNINKIPHFELILLLLISYLSFFVPKYGILLIIYYCHYKLTIMKKILNKRLVDLDKKKQKIIPKSEDFSSIKSRTIPSVSSCQVCKAFKEPKFDSVAHFKNKKLENRRNQEAGFRNQNRQNQRQPPR